MTLLHVAIVAVRGHDANANAQPVPQATAKASESLTAEGTTTALSSADWASDGEIFDITVSGGDFYVAIGDDPDASADPRHLMLDGQNRQFFAEAADQKVDFVAVA